MKEWSVRWLLKQAKKDGLRVCFVKLDNNVVSKESHGFINDSIKRHAGQG